MDQLPEDIIKDVNGFIGERSYLFTRIFCKNWDKGDHRVTNYTNAVQNISMLNEAIGNGILKKCDHVKLFNHIVLHGNMYVMKYFWRKYKDEKIHNTETLGFSIDSGSLENLRWLIDHVKCDMNTTTFTNAVKCGNLDVLDLLEDKVCPMDKGIMYTAISSGDIATIEWLYDKCDDSYGDDIGALADYIAGHGTVEVMKWMGEVDGLVIGEETMQMAFSAGNVEMMKYLQEEGCPLCTIDYGMIEDNDNRWSIESIRYMRSIGAEWGNISYQMGYSGTNEEIEWVIEHGYTDIYIDMHLHIEGALEVQEYQPDNLRMDAIELMCNNFIIPTSAFSVALCHMRLDVMKLLHSKNCQWGFDPHREDVIILHCIYDFEKDCVKSVEIAKWMREECPQGLEFILDALASVGF